MEIKLMVPELVTDFDGVFALQPGEVVVELSTVDGLEAEAGPLHSKLSVRDVSGERHVRSARRLVEKPALVCSPELVGPVDEARNRRATHEPAIPGHGRVI